MIGGPATVVKNFSRKTHVWNHARGQNMISVIASNGDTGWDVFYLEGRVSHNLIGGPSPVVENFVWHPFVEKYDSQLTMKTMQVRIYGESLPPNTHYYVEAGTMYSLFALCGSDWAAIWDPSFPNASSKKHDFHKSGCIMICQRFWCKKTMI